MLFLGFQGSPLAIYNLIPFYLKCVFFFFFWGGGGGGGGVVPKSCLRSSNMLHFTRINGQNSIPLFFHHFLTYFKHILVWVVLFHFFSRKSFLLYFVWLSTISWNHRSVDCPCMLKLVGYASLVVGVIG
jgi:hypothetical protein